MSIYFQGQRHRWSYGEASNFSAKHLSDDPSQADLLEKILRRINARQMPPPDFDDRPQEKDYVEAASAMLDDNFDANPRVGELATMRRLIRTEYQNAIRDLLGVQVDASTLLPKDESSHGFDNITVADLSPTLINRYLSAAEKISQSAVGASSQVVGTNIRVAADRTQEAHVEGLPPENGRAASSHRLRPRGRSTPR